MHIFLHMKLRKTQLSNECRKQKSEVRKDEHLRFAGISLSRRERRYCDNEKAATRRQDISCMGCSNMRYSYMLCTMVRILGAILFNPEFAESQRSSYISVCRDSRSAIRFSGKYISARA